jgi:ubiquinone/menaquinone biosynthesis C-methylase UbiE
MKSVTFDAMVEHYDETRVFDGDCFRSALAYLSQRFPPQDFCRLLEPGIGTGRIAIPLAKTGYDVCGVDVSINMLRALKRRLQQLPPGSVSFQMADATALPFPGEAFDLAVAVHLFYFILTWTQTVDEIVRVVRRGGAIILMHTGTGAEVPFLNERYKALCAEMDWPLRLTGAKSTRDVVDYLGRCGYSSEWIRDPRWAWTACIPLDRALGYLRQRAYSFTNFAPDWVHRTAMKRLESEMQAQYGSLNVEIEVPNQIYLVVVRKEPVQTSMDGLARSGR